MTLREANERHTDIRSNITARMEAMTALTEGASMTKNQAEAFDRHERKHDELVAELRSLEADHPELKSLSFEEGRALACPPIAPISIDNPIDIGEARRVAANGAPGTMTAFVEERCGSTGVINKV